MLSHADYALTELCVYREGSGEPRAGQVAIAWSVKNRVLKHGTTPYEEVTKKWQFTSITGTGDPNLTRFGDQHDPTWQQCQIIADGVLEGSIGDPTNGSTLYYNPDAIETDVEITLTDGRVIPFPKTWNRLAVRFVLQIGKHYFFQEI